MTRVRVTALVLLLAIGVKTQSWNTGSYDQNRGHYNQQGGGYNSGGYNDNQDPRYRQSGGISGYNANDRYGNSHSSFQRDSNSIEPFRVVFEWYKLDYAWTDEMTKAQYLNNRRFIPENNAIAGIKTWRDRVFVTIPRWKEGVPVTIASIPSSPTQNHASPRLEPFPNWQMQEIGNCSAFQFVQSMEIDTEGRMWVLDAGRVNILEGARDSFCSPKLVIIDLNSVNFQNQFGQGFQGNQFGPNQPYQPGGYQGQNQPYPGQPGYQGQNQPYPAGQSGYQGQNQPYPGQPGYQGTNQQYPGQSGYQGSNQQYPGPGQSGYQGSNQQYPGQPGYQGSNQQYPGPGQPGYQGSNQQYGQNQPPYNRPYNDQSNRGQYGGGQFGYNNSGYNNFGSYPGSNTYNSSYNQGYNSNYNQQGGYQGNYQGQGYQNPNYNQGSGYNQGGSGYNQGNQPVFPTPFPNANTFNYNFLSNARIVKSFNFPSNVASQSGSYLNDIVLDNSNGWYAYITDHGDDPGIIVYSFREDRSWKVKDARSMRSDPDTSYININNIDVDLRHKNLDGIALSPQFDFERTVYYSPLGSYNLYSLPTSVLKNPNLPSDVSNSVRDLGKKPSISDGMIMDNRGTLYYGLLHLNAIGKWDSKRQPDFETGQFIMSKDNNLLQWADSFSIDDNGNIWVVTNRLQNYLTGSVNLEQPNFRILKGFIGSKSYQYPYDNSAPAFDDRYNALGGGGRSSYYYNRYNSGHCLTANLAILLFLLSDLFVR